jgi:hypothetical protein
MHLLSGMHGAIRKGRGWIVPALMCLSFPAYGTLRPEPNAFLNRPAHTTAQLVAQVKADPEVMSRFMRHFRMDKKELIVYLSRLKLVRLKQDGHYTIYNADKDNVIGSRLFHVKKGALIWAEPDGTLVLKKGCGNPLSTGPRSVQNAKMRAEAAMIPTGILRHIPASGEPEPLELMPAAEILQPTFIIETAANEVATVPAVTPTTQALPQVVRGGGFPAGLLLAPLLLVFDNGGGGPGNQPGPPPPPPPPGIPGPAAALAFIAAGAAQRLRKGRR